MAEERPAFVDGSGLLRNQHPDLLVGVGLARLHRVRALVVRVVDEDRVTSRQ